MCRLHTPRFRNVQHVRIKLAQKFAHGLGRLGPRLTDETIDMQKVRGARGSNLPGHCSYPHWYRAVYLRWDAY
jgi:hypothetical protein